MGFGRIALVGLLSLAGCDSYTTGIVWKDIEGSLRNPTEHSVRYFTPAQRIEGTKVVDEKFDVWARTDLISGQVEANPLNVWAKGHWESFGVGLSYYPFSRDSNPRIRGDLGTNLDHIGVDMKGRMGPISTDVHDSIWTWGVSAGATLEYDLSANTSLVVSGGYSLTDNHTNKATADFDGGYGFVGLKFTLP